jgi:hypothetical protein
MTMHHAQQQAIASYYAADQLSISLRAARTAELWQSFREQRMARKAQRKARRAARTSQEAYTTAV